MDGFVTGKWRPMTVEDDEPQRESDERATDGAPDGAGLDEHLQLRLCLSLGTGDLNRM